MEDQLGKVLHDEVDDVETHPWVKRSLQLYTEEHINTIGLVWRGRKEREREKERERDCNEDQYIVCSTCTLTSCLWASNAISPTNTDICRV